MPLKQPQGRGFKIGIVYFAPDPGADSCMQGIFDGLRDLGLEEGKNLEICKTHAQGEIINIPALLQNYDPEFVERGALACAGLGFYQAGYAAAKLARRVLQGEIPKYLPFAEVAVKTTSLNFAVAGKLGVIFSPELIHECDVFVDLASRYGRPARIAFIEAHNDAGGCRLFQGLLAGLGDAGLLKEKDYTTKTYTPNLVTGRLSEIIPDIRDFNPELVIAENEETANEAKKIIKEKPLLNIADISKANKPFTSDNFETGRRAAIQIARILAGGTD